MSDASQASGPEAGTRQPKFTIKPIGFADITEAMAGGLRDFQAAPVYGLVFGGVYALGGWILLYLLTSYEVPWLIYPLAVGFALIAPFIAAGLYEVSRRRETGEPLTWMLIAGSVYKQTGRDLGWMALVTTFAFIIWIDIAVFLYVMFFGLEPLKFPELLYTVITTPQGMLFLLMGNVIGAFLGFVVFSITAISFPLLLDRDVDFITAMITSAQAVTANPRVMLGWAILILMLFVVSLMSMFIALVVVLPVLGHATWHVYRRVIKHEQQDETV